MREFEGTNQLVRLLVRPFSEVVQVLRTTSVTSRGPAGRFSHRKQPVTTGPLSGPVWSIGIKWYWSGPGVCLRTPPTDHLYQRANILNQSVGTSHAT